ncbi:MAG: EAL domain-containing protein [Epsilonproteobacteria bacterium]|nr:EAL domain-containing protein [Campylobacterota bacterium]
MEKRAFKKYTYPIEAPNDIPDIIEKIKSLEHPYMLGLIYSYIHNTVIVQSLKKELQNTLPKIKLTYAHQRVKRGAKLVIYGFDYDVKDATFEAEVITLLEEKSRQFENDLKNCRKDLVQKYFNDHLTNIPNIFKLRKDLQECEDITIIDVVIDDFKSINSFYGFLVGDYLLEKVAEHLVGLSNASVYKMPGGEFILVIEKYFHYYELKEYIENLYEMISSLEIYYNDVKIGFDFTLASCTAHSIENILAKLSMALMYAKEHKLPFFIYEDRLELNSHFKENLALISKVRNAIKNDRIVAYYQPIIDNKTQKVVKFETLARLFDEDGEVLAPDQFLDISKRTKLYYLVTRKMIQSAFYMFENNEFEFSVNISKDDILNQETFDFILDTLKKSPASDRVIFEFLESDAIKEADRIIEFVNEIRRYGARIAIDDFGSGYSNFSMIINMKVDFLKIDGSLISNIDTNPNSLLVVESIVDFSKKLGVEVIAEYVHSSTILSKVKKLGIEFSQGFYIDKPRIDIDKTEL